MSTILSKSIILVADPLCVSTIRYSTKHKPAGMYKDYYGTYWTAFEYNEGLEDMIEAYANGDWSVTVPGYIETHDIYMNEYESEIDVFDDENHHFKSGEPGELL